MLKKIKFIMPFCVFLLPLNANAQLITGVIHTIHSNLESRIVHVYMDGNPVFEGTVCSNKWTGNTMDDLDFKNYILPILLTAKASGKSVTIGTRDCTAQYPKIYYVDMDPR